MFNQENLDRVLGGTVVDESGDKIGKVGDVYFDDVTNKPSWVTVNTGLFGTSNSFVPLDNASMEGDTIRVPFSKDKVKDAPRIDADRHLSVEEERELYRYYGADYDAGRDARGRDADRGADGDAMAAGGGMAAGGVAGGMAGRDRGMDPDRGADHGADGDARFANDPDRGADHGADAQAGLAGRGRGMDPDRGADGGAGMTLHEERLNVGTEQRETGRVRLRKHVVTENETVTVPVTREEVHLEREPVREGETADRHAFREGQADEVTLHEDRVVVDKEAVPTERVGLGTERVTEERQVNEQVRREEADVDRTGGRGGVDYDRDGKVGMGDRAKGAMDRDHDGDVVEGRRQGGVDYNDDGKVGLGDRIKGVFDKDKDGRPGR